MGRPLFLTQVMRISLILSFVFAFGAIFSFFDVPGIKYDINGHGVNHQYWLMHGVPGFILVSVTLLIVSYVIKKEFVWGKKLGLALLIANVLFSIFTLIKFMESQGISPINLVNLLSSIVGLGLGYWYFYMKNNVVKYYESLKK